MLVTYWRSKLGLDEMDASEAIVQLKNHPTAGTLLRQLESWLHMPADRSTEVDLNELLDTLSRRARYHVTMSQKHVPEIAK